ncbi:hypothetical protein RhiirC2_712002 [Rhizophagus irregularis]|uniref:Uncharacterized protein n=1 Tax=Rhizophagus irregularis TaxID=588596 RepID=A0A2N1N8X4_9GLOM|nr:hypothetical protein RhiirC2_712002 [Rhizophagus irregularis]
MKPLVIQVNNSVVHYNANNIASDAVFLITDRENSNNFQTLLTLDIILGLEKKLRSFKTKKDLSEVLSKYEFVSGDITRNPQFIPRKQSPVKWFFIKIFQTHISVLQPPTQLTKAPPNLSYALMIFSAG